MIHKNLSYEKADNKIQISNWRKTLISRRTFSIVRFLKIVFLLLQQRVFLLSGFRLHTSHGIRISNYLQLLIIYYGISNFLLIPYLSKEWFSLRERKTIVSFLSISNLTFIACFFHFLLSGFFILFYHIRYGLLSKQSSIVRFLQDCNMTFNSCIVRFFKICILTIEGGLNAEVG